MNAVVRWIVVAVAALVIVGLLAYARGRTHHRGDDVGAIPAGLPLVAVRPVTGL
jgi:hypothetical protein